MNAVILPLPETGFDARFATCYRLLMPTFLLAFVLCFAGCAGIAIPAAMGQNSTVPVLRTK